MTHATHRALYITTCPSCAAEYADPLTVWPDDPPEERRMPVELIVCTAVVLAVVAALLYREGHR